MALRVLFVGAGAVNFGGAEGPWDHSRRLETLEGIKIVGIADPDYPKASAVLEEKRRCPHSSAYQECSVYRSCAEALDAAKPDVAFIGVPPYCHGTEQAPLDLELQCLRKGVHIFVEKPVSLRPPEEFLSYVEHVEELQRAKGLVVSVGYMFRYHPAIKKMKEILSQHSRPLLHVNARYNCTYAALDHPFWWNKDKSGGPIVEQATHFCDLMRYFGGEVDLPKLRAICVPPSDDPTSPGSLSRVPEVVREGQLLLAQRIPRATCAQFCFTSGALGSLTHAAALQGRKYEAQIDVWADGLRMALEEPYFPECKLRVRIGNTDEEQVYTFPDADPYLGEVRAFISAVRDGNPSGVRSTYRDAFLTYQLSWMVRRASENN